MSVLVTGSIAFDAIFTHPGVFGEALEASDLNNVSLSFFSTGYSEQDGGCAANIAYNLALLGINHDVAALIGSDGNNYLGRMNMKGINTTRIQKSQLPTARCTLFTDSTGAQINAFYPGAMTEHYTRPVDLQDYQIIIVSPNNPDQMERWVELARDTSMGIIFDPGQAIHALSPDQLSKGFEHASVIIMNRAEHEASMDKYNDDIITNPDYLGWIVITDGADGSYVFHRGEQVAAIPVFEATEVVDPTGAGDAYRAGLIWGMLNGDIVQGCTFGAELAALKISNHGGQNHQLSENLMQLVPTELEAQ